jgi:hypothetical protein
VDFGLVDVMAAQNGGASGVARLQFVDTFQQELAQGTVERNAAGRGAHRYPLTQP